MELLTGKTALITGAAKGIGKSIALAFAKQGANVAFTYLSSEAAALQLEQALQELGIKAKGYQSDASDYATATLLIKDVLEDFGGELDILVNNAGITKDSLLMRMKETDWDEVLTTNLKSVFNMCQAATKPMMDKKKGAIINVSSIVGLTGNAGQCNYAASKAGMIGFSKSLAKELGSRNIRVNVLAPGFIETDMTDKLKPEQSTQWIKNIPLQHFGQPEDVAQAAVFLASDMSSYITGQTLCVCGGMHS